jgi:hypothetical protein
MTKIKLEHIDNLRLGKKSWLKIGSRWVSYHLYKYEEGKYKKALKYKYLEITQKDRVNLRNIWQKVCIAKWWQNYTLIKDNESWNAKIFLNDIELQSWETKVMKQEIRKQA